MKEETEFIIGAVFLIIAAGLLSFGFSGLTGYAGKEISSTSIQVSPNSVNAGEYVNINVNTNGKRGVQNYFSICKDNKLCFSRGWLHCTGYGCREDINVKYRIPSNIMPGKYFVKVHDLDNKEDAIGYFNIE